MTNISLSFSFSLGKFLFVHPETSTSHLTGRH